MLLPTVSNILSTGQILSHLRRMKLYAVFTIFLRLMVFVLSHCPDGWVGHENSCYHFSRDRESMPVASTVCQKLGGGLVEINSAQENEYIHGQIKTSTNYWIGANDLEEEGVWRWYDSGRRLTCTHYTNWYDGEPNNGGKIENCAFIFYSNGKWFDYLCYKFLNYICETPRE